MSLSDEQEQSLLEIMEDTWGADAPTFFKSFMKKTKDMGMTGDTMYDTIMKACLVAKLFGGSFTGEEFRAAMGASLLPVVDQSVPKTDPSKTDPPKPDPPKDKN